MEDVKRNVAELTEKYEKVITLISLMIPEARKYDGITATKFIMQMRIKMDEVCQAKGLSCRPAFKGCNDLIMIRIRSSNAPSSPQMYSLQIHDVFIPVNSKVRTVKADALITGLLKETEQIRKKIAAVQNVVGSEESVLEQLRQTARSIQEFSDMHYPDVFYALGLLYENPVYENRNGFGIVVPVKTELPAVMTYDMFEDLRDTVCAYTNYTAMLETMIPCVRKFDRQPAGRKFENALQEALEIKYGSKAKHSVHLITGKDEFTIRLFNKSVVCHVSETCRDGANTWMISRDMTSGIIRPDSRRRIIDSSGMICEMTIWIREMEERKEILRRLPENLQQEEDAIRSFVSSLQEFNGKYPPEVFHVLGIDYSYKETDEIDMYIPNAVLS